MSQSNSEKYTKYIEVQILYTRPAEKETFLSDQVSLALNVSDLLLFGAGKPTGQQNRAEVLGESIFMEESNSKYSEFYLFS